MKSHIQKDCLQERRIFYYLENEIEDAFLSHFSEDKITVNEFSKMVKNAKDHFVIIRPGCFHASGVIGEKLVVFKFAKQSLRNEANPQKEVEDFLQLYETT